MTALLAITVLSKQYDLKKHALCWAAAATAYSTAASTTTRTHAHTGVLWQLNFVQWHLIFVGL
jgi:hypothetical protein